MSEPTTNNLTKFAIAGGFKGTGLVSSGLGFLVAKELLSSQREGLQVKIITRSTSSFSSPQAEELRNLGAQIIEVDYSVEETLVQALNGSEVVCSFLGAGEGLAEPQQVLARSAKKIGAKIFVPSEYSLDTRITHPAGGLGAKTEMHYILEKKLMLPYTLIFTGPWMEFVTTYLDPKDNQVMIVGDGNTKVSWTALSDVAEFTAKALLDLTNKVLLVEGCSMSFNEIVAAYNTKHGTTLEITYTDPKGAWKKWEQEKDFLMALKWELAIGNGSVLAAGNEQKLFNGMWKDWNPKGLQEFL